jgi:hypothetical protein
MTNPLAEPRERFMWHDITSVVRDLQRAVTGALDPYRPEQHYMRGPGPKCQAKRGAPAKSAASIGDTAEALSDVAQAHA